MMQQLKRRIEVLETCRFGSPRVAAMRRRFRTMSVEERADLVQCLVDGRLNDLPPLFDLTTLTEEEREAIAVVSVPDTD